jgi:hypothetical protein
MHYALQLVSEHYSEEIIDAVKMAFYQLNWVQRESVFFSPSEREIISTVSSNEVSNCERKYDCISASRTMLVGREFCVTFYLHLYLKQSMKPSVESLVHEEIMYEYSFDEPPSDVNRKRIIDAVCTEVDALLARLWKALQ